MKTREAWGLARRPEEPLAAPTTGAPPISSPGPRQGKNPPLAGGASELTTPGATTCSGRAPPSSKQDTRNEIAPLLDTGSGRGRSEARVLVAVAAAAAAAVPAAAAAAASITAAAAAASVAALAVPAAAAAPTTPITATSPIAAAAAAPAAVPAAAVPATAIKIAALLLRLELRQNFTDLERELVEVLLLAEG